MGIPRFYRWLSERYPLINENITAEQIPDFDNLYLDMNGIIHNCSHNNTGGLCQKEESDVFVEAFSYICRLVQIIRPKKILYMAVDGCAPRAKMNQQRSRRFRAANDAREAKDLALQMGEDISGPHFDSNCITPGTEFMAKLTEHLRFFICKKIQEDPAWQSFTVVLSGPETAGEGEHKIMDYIRKAKAQPDHDPNTRHCLYGLDADLIMLSLASHEPHFALLREEVVFGRRETKTTDQRMLIAKDRFQLLHVSLLREYLDIEFAPQIEPKFHNLERIIDDFILFCVLVGNDFLPCLPFAEIGQHGLEDLFRVYKDHLASSSASSSFWLTKNCGEVDFKQFSKFLKKYGELEDGHLQSACDEQEFTLGKQRLVGLEEAPAPKEYAPDLPIEPPPTSEMAREQWYEVKFAMDVNDYEGTQKQRKLFQSYLEGLHWVMRYYFRGPDHASWSWYYPFYHAPMAFDLANYDNLSNPEISLQVGMPFKPFQQLMAVLPSSSKTLLPSCYQWLFDSHSPVANFYPEKFVVDMDGVKVPWGGMTLIPFIDPERLLLAMEQAFNQGPPLSSEEKKRDEFRMAKSFQYDMKAGVFVKSTVPRKYGDIQRCPVRINEFQHLALPGEHFPNYLLSGVRTKEMGFPTLHEIPFTTSFQVGVKVFQFEAKGLSMYLHLRPTSPFEPTEEAIRARMRSLAIIDYPCMHRGKIIALHTPYAKYLHDGAQVENNPFEHEKRVWNLLQEYRKRGLTVEFDSSAIAVDETSAGRMWRGKAGDLSENELCQQPLVEVKMVQSLYVDSHGRAHATYQAGSELRLWHLIRVDETPPSTTTTKLSERFMVGTAVLCIDQASEAFGELGRIQRSSTNPKEIEALFQRQLSSNEKSALQQKISQVIEQEQTGLKWYDMTQFIKMIELEANVTRQIIGTLMARCADYVREDLGMNLMVEANLGEADPEPGGGERKKEGDKPAFCLPCYSIKRPQGWFFSDLAVSALKDYQTKFPGLFEALRARRDQSKDLEQRQIFPTSVNKDYSSRQLLKYCNACEWKKLRLAPVQYMAMTAGCVVKVADVVEDALGQQGEAVTVTGCSSFHHAEDPSLPPPEISGAKDLALGQRGFYVKVMRSVPCGAQGTIIGVYGGDAHQHLEVLLDKECFGATDLHGRCPPLRGIQMPASMFRPFSSRATSTSEQTQRMLEKQRAGNAASFGREAPKPETDEIVSQALKKLLQVTQASASRDKPRTKDDRALKEGETMEWKAPVKNPSRPTGSKGSSNKVNREPEKLEGDIPAAFAALTGAPAQIAQEVESGAARLKLSAPAKPAPAARKGHKKDLEDVWRKAFTELLACGKKG
ncbi:unnamed protein product [Durusdinium trenchii]|uniref:Uncharacterized protein n=1 Tax=Durusdinium trenchii TaxID=1381693 RepID=A0ABP0MU44_9DINO